MARILEVDQDPVAVLEEGAAWEEVEILDPVEGVGARGEDIADSSLININRNFLKL